MSCSNGSRVPHWVAATDVEEEGTFRWSDGTLVDGSPVVWGNGQSRATSFLGHH